MTTRQAGLVATLIAAVIGAVGWVATVREIDRHTKHDGSRL